MFDMTFLVTFYVTDSDTHFANLLISLIHIMLKFYDTDAHFKKFDVTEVFLFTVFKIKTKTDFNLF